jgi:capsular exopolysaccharide synthesis family protein
MGLVLGLLSGVMLAFGVDFFDRTVKTPEDVERDLRLPFLAAVPAFEKSWKESSGGVLMPLTARALDAGGGYLPAASDVYWESYRALRTALLFSSPEEPPRSILMTSAMPGEGKSTTTVNLAIALAQTGARTLIVELDMRRPRLAQMFQLSRRHGMSRYLSGQSDLNTEVQQTGVPNLFVVPAGPVPPNPPELMGSPRMKSALDLFGRYFQYVIIDGPPLVPVADALVIAAQVSGVVLVVQGGKTPKAAVQKARNLLMSVNAKIFGTLVNNVTMDGSQVYYSGTYSSAQETYQARTDTVGLHAK